MSSAPSSEKPAAGTINFERRTWDKEEFAARAAARSAAEAAAAAGGPPLPAAPGLTRAEPAPYRDAPEGAAGPAGSRRAFLTSRTYEVDLEGKLGKRRLVTDTTPVAAQGGYWCELCQCTLRDSLGYLDHINGKKREQCGKCSGDCARARGSNRAARNTTVAPSHLPPL